MPSDHKDPIESPEISSNSKKSKKTKKEKREKLKENKDLPNNSQEIANDDADEENYTRELRRRAGTRSTYKLTLGKTIQNPATLTWSDVVYQVPQKKQPPKVILNKVSGCVKPGQVLAILGASGAGKTSLLNTLARRITKGTVEGSIKVNGIDIVKNKTYLQLTSGYVMQDDVLFANLTVRETLMYSAMLRLPESISIEQKKERVEQVIQELGLSKVADSRIGSVSRRGISGGERKRVCIGTELITDPALLFLDEPTSGLDAFTSFSLMETLLGLAKSGRTVVCTIHQPRSNIFNLFDMLLIMSEGREVYFGPAKNSVEYFSRLNFKCPKYVNPADYFLDIVSLSQMENKEEENIISNKNMIEAYQESKEYQAQRELVEKESKKAGEVALPPGGFATGYLLQTKLLFERSSKNVFRDKLSLIIRLIQTLIFSFFIGLIYLRMDNNQKSISDRAGVLFFLIINQVFGNVTGVLATFAEEKLIFKRERASRMYRVSPYYVTRSFSELPALYAFPLLYCFITYWLVGLQADAEKFFIFCGIILLCVFVSSSLGYTISALAPNATVANLLAPIVIIIFFMFAGYYVNTENIPVFFLPLEYLSFMKYLFIALMKNEFSGLELTCSQDEFIQPGNICPFTTGEEALKTFAFQDLSISECCLIALAIGVFLRIVGYLLLRFVSKE